MSDIPHSYRKYIDDVTKMTQRGAISSGEQQASPSSAGSRGLAKTTQFTNNKTQMQLGQEAIAESMVDIRNIMNRIDGVNVPTNEMNELADNDKMEFTKVLLDISVIKDRVQALSVDEDAKASAIQSLTSAEESLVALDESAVQEGHYPHIKSFDKLYGINDMQQYKAMADDAQSMDMGEFMDTYSSVIDMAGDFWEDHQKTSESNEDVVNEDPNTLAKELASEIMRYVRKGFDHIPADALKAKAKEYLSSIKESAVKEDDGDERAIAAMKLAKDENRKEGFDYPQGGKYGYKAERGSGTGAMGTMQVNVTIHDRETDETMHIKDMNYLELEKGDEQETLAMIWDENRDLIQKESAVQEDDGEQALANDLALFFAKRSKELLQSMERPDKNDQEYEEFVDIAQAFKKGIQAGLDEVNMSDFEFSNNPFGDFGRGIDDGPDEELVDILNQHGYQPGPDGANDKATIVKQKEESADSGELSRLKELSGMEAPKESEKAVSEDIGDKGRIALEKAGFDPMKVKEYMAVFNDHGDTSDIDQMNMDKVGLADAMAMVLASHDVENESYQPMPEGDEFDIEEDEDFEEVLGPLGFPEDETELFDAEYQGRKVPLNKPMRGDVKKFKVYVKDPKTGNVKKVNFGHGGTSAKRPTMRIRKSNPKARKSFRARHNCANPGPKTKARYWSCRKW